MYVKYNTWLFLIKKHITYFFKRIFTKISMPVLTLGIFVAFLVMEKTKMIGDK